MASSRDLYGLQLTAPQEAADHFNSAISRLLTLRRGVEKNLEKAIEVYPDFALAHAVLATQMAERGASKEDYRPHIHAARSSALAATEREGSFVTASVLWCSDGLSGDRVLVKHVRRWPRDAYAVSLMAPSIASGGVSNGVVDVWPMLDELVSEYGDDWWLTSLRAFARTEQLRFSEAEDLAGRALQIEPAAGHACHAQAHVLYETGRHNDAAGWIDRWLAGAGSDQAYRCHFSWHAALFELAQGDISAVRNRFDRELSQVDGTRALVDAGSMVARCAIHGFPLGNRRTSRTCRAAGSSLELPGSPFLAWNAAILAGVRHDGEALGRLSTLAAEKAVFGSPTDPVHAGERKAWTMVGRICGGLSQAVSGDFSGAARILTDLGDTSALGGSPAQRELIDDLALDCLCKSGQRKEAERIAESRLVRRTTNFDRRLCRRGR